VIEAIGTTSATLFAMELCEQIEAQLRRISGGASGYPVVREASVCGMPCLIRMGIDDASMVCDAESLLSLLQALPDGAASGSAHEPESVWAAVRQAHGALWALDDQEADDWFKRQAVAETPGGGQFSRSDQ
jgi:hypothetical protein